jgi:hypothetical protein
MCTLEEFIAIFERFNDIYNECNQLLARGINEEETAKEEQVSANYGD